MPIRPDDRFSLVLQVTGAGYWEWCARDEPLTVSPQLLALFGIEGDAEVRPRERLSACVDADDLKRLGEIATEADQSGRPYTAVIRVRRENDGDLRWMRLVGQSFGLYTPDHSAVGTVVDITEERALLHSLHHAQRQLEDAEQLAGVGSWSWDITSGDVHWSKETYRILNVPAGTTPSFDQVLALATDDANRRAFLEHVDGALTRGAPYDFEINARLNNGSLITIHTRGSVERSAEGVPVRMVGTMQDVTSMRAAERALKKSEELFRTLAESSPTGIILTDAAFVPTYLNQRLLEWYDLSLAEFADGQWRRRIHPADLPRVVGLLKESLRPPRAFTDEYRIVANGVERWLLVRTEPQFSADGHFVGLVGSVLDTSAERFAAAERARLQAQLQQARKLESLGLLAGGIAHDFNNLLVGIMANASVAREDVAADSALAEVLADIDRSAQRAAELTRQLLAYGGRAQMDRRTVDLAHMAQEMPVLLRGRVAADVSLHVRVDVEQCLVHGDETQLRQVLMNLVTNAIDAIDGTGAVTVRVSRKTLTKDDLVGSVLGSEREPGEFVIVTVQDTGRGMSSDVVERMFDPFFTTKTAGRGLGLAATLGILNGHAGAIDVHSVEGQGTSMRLLLPHASRDDSVIPVDDRDMRTTAVRDVGVVLLVDDDATVRTAARRALQRAGFTVVEAENGQHAIDQFERAPETFACVVLDLSMPVMNGDVCLRELRARRPNIPVLLSTGYDASDVVRGIVDQREAAFLQKPYAAGELLRAVRRTIAHAQTADESSAV